MPATCHPELRPELCPGATGQLPPPLGLSTCLTHSRCSISVETWLLPCGDSISLRWRDSVLCFGEDAAQILEKWACPMHRASSARPAPLRPHPRLQLPPRGPPGWLLGNAVPLGPSCLGRVWKMGSPRLGSSGVHQSLWPTERFLMFFNRMYWGDID